MNESIRKCPSCGEVHSAYTRSNSNELLCQKCGFKFSLDWFRDSQDSENASDDTNKSSSVSSLDLSDRELIHELISLNRETSTNIQEIAKCLADMRWDSSETTNNVRKIRLGIAAIIVFIFFGGFTEVVKVFIF